MTSSERPQRSGTWSLVAQSLARPYRVTLPMVILVGMVPFYVFIASGMNGRTVHVPELPLDRALPLQPVWALVYGALYLCLILLPVFLVRDEELIRQTVLAFLLVWITAYACFILYPTVAPRPETLSGSGFAVWGLRVLYDADPPYNCFPSLHVAHSFVSALASFRVHRAVGTVAIVAAAIVALSTLFTKQHYVADVIGGVFLALVAYRIFLRGFARERVPPLDHMLAPVFAGIIAAIAAMGVVGFWLFYLRFGT